jgi:hypothetical protein
MLRRLSPSLLVGFTCFLAACKPRSDTRDGADDLTQTLQMENGLVTARYPASFKGERYRQGAVFVSHRYLHGTGQITFIALDKPSSSTLEDFVRDLEADTVKTIDSWVETGRKQTTCNGQPGVEVIGTFRNKFGAPCVRRACHFFRNGHGYSFSIVGDKDVVATEEAALVRIREAAQLNPVTSALRDGAAF